MTNAFFLGVLPRYARNDASNDADINQWAWDQLEQWSLDGIDPRDLPEECAP